MDKAIDILAAKYKMNSESILKDFFTFLRFQSVSSEPEFKEQVLACAGWLEEKIKKMGFDVEVWKTEEHHPVIFASYLKAGSDQPTLLIYNHYDVQPVDPIEEWATPPFEPSLRGGEVFARGAQDNKGQCFYVLQAIKALLEQEGTLPINIKWCIEGEEEKGSAGLTQLLKMKDKQKLLKADYLAIVDSGLREAGVPAVTLGVRGITTMEVEIQDSNGDLHSGSHGGIVYNPIHALVELLSKLRDPAGHILVPGFYDDVKEFGAKEKSVINFEFDNSKYEKMFGTKPLGGEQKYTPLERAWTRPTIEINGICGGYHGPGFKTVIPSKAIAKISCRLVPNQDPHKIAELVSKFLQDNAPKGLKVSVKLNPGGGEAVRASITSKVVEAFAKSYGEVFGKPCEYIFEGGSIPIVTELSKASGSEVVLLGMGLADDHIHAPNEHFGVDRLEKGFLVIARAIQILAKK